MVKTVHLSEDTWRRLSFMKIERGFRSLDEVVRHLLNCCVELTDEEREILARVREVLGKGVGKEDILEMLDALARTADVSSTR